MEKERNEHGGHVSIYARTWGVLHYRSRSQAAAVARTLQEGVRSGARGTTWISPVDVNGCRLMVRPEDVSMILLEGTDPPAAKTPDATPAAAPPEASPSAGDGVLS